MTSVQVLKWTLWKCSGPTALLLNEHKTHAHKVDDGLSHLGEVKILRVAEVLQAGVGPLSGLDWFPVTQEPIQRRDGFVQFS